MDTVIYILSVSGTQYPAPPLRAVGTLHGEYTSMCTDLDLPISIRIGYLGSTP